jgi:hypothetical protein
MSPEEHYREAEHLIEQVNAATPEWRSLWGALALRQAQVHATLAACPPSFVLV